MNLDDAPTAPPVISETLVIKPNNQNNITRTNGNKQILIEVPDYVRYFLPSQSFFQADVTMTGRGNPIPSSSAGFHSFWRRITCRDGRTNANILDEIDYYNTYASQLYTTMKTDQINNDRLMFQGLQPTDSYTDNLYWEMQQTNTWASTTNCAGANVSGINDINSVAKSVQISTPLQTELLSTDDFVPVNVLGGLNMELQIEDYRRALEYTHGNSGVENGFGMCPGKLDITNGVDCCDVVGGVVGDGFNDGRIYQLRVGSATGLVCGYVIVNTVNGATDKKLATVDWYCTSTDPVCPPTYATGTLTIVAPAGGANATVRIKADTIPYGNLRRGSQDAPYFIDLATGTPTECLGTQTSTNNAFWGDGTLRDPFRTLNPITNANAGLSANNQQPVNNLPFSVGDRLFVSVSNNGDEKQLGLVTGFSISDTTNTVAGTGVCRVYFSPNAVVIPSGLSNDAVVPTGAGANGVGSTYAYNFATNGYQLYVKEVDRLNGVPTQANINAPSYSPRLITNSTLKIDFTISDLEYHVKRVMMDASIDNNDMSLANGAGYKFDLNSTATTLVNVTNVLGPTQQLIALPNIRRGLGILSIPLNQNDQFSISKKSLVGDPRGSPVASNIALQQGMTNYQYNLGSLVGRQPYRPVDVRKYSFKNPLIQTGAVTELIKANDSFGFNTSCLQALGMNFALGRALARPGQFFDIVQAGNIELLANYENVASANKLFCHFVRHLRRVNISKMGIMIQN